MSALSSRLGLRPNSRNTTLAVGAGVVAFALGSFLVFRAVKAKREQKQRAARRGSFSRMANVDWDAFEHKFRTKFASSDSLTRKEVEERWNEFDVDGNGFLDKDELHALVRSVLTGVALQEAELTNAVSSLFGDEDASIVDDAFVQSIVRDLNENARVQELVQRFDSNLDGKVDKQEFVDNFGDWFHAFAVERIHGHIVGEKKQKMPSAKPVQKLTDDIVLMYWDKYDTDRNGVLDETELQYLITDVLTEIARQKAKFSAGLTQMFGEEDAMDSKAIQDMVAEMRPQGRMKELVKRFDQNRNKRIEKAEFMNQFGQWFVQYSAAHSTSL